MRQKDWRQAEGWTTYQLAARLGTADTSVGRYENGRRLPGRVELARLFLLSQGRVQPNDYHFPSFAAAQQALVELALHIADLSPPQGAALFERLDAAAAAYREQLAALLEPAEAAQ